MSRRSALTVGLWGFAGAVLAQYGTLIPRSARAQGSQFRQEIERLEKLLDTIDASRTRQQKRSVFGGDEFSSSKERLLDLMDAGAKLGTRGQEIIDRADELLALMTAEEAQTPKGLQDKIYNSEEQRAKFTFNAETRAEYKKLFENINIRDQHRPAINRDVDRALGEERYQSYKEIEKRTATPWYLVAAIHNLECSFNMNRHLHNGDKLGARTTNVPKGRPTQWLPPSDWASSAVDALEYDGFLSAPDQHGGWSVELMLFQLERYNGIGYRRRGINSPYLWSYSNHYLKGKYVSDGKWDSEAVSRQCGAAVLIKALIERGAIAEPPYYKPEV